jgi:STE24 endopeptidase
MYIRFNEFQADAFSVKLGYGKQLKDGMAKLTSEILCSPYYLGLVRLQSENLSTMDPDYYYSTYHYSHPPLVERLEAITKNSDYITKKTQ